MGLGTQMKQRKDELEEEDGPIEAGPVPESGERDARASNRSASTRASKRS
jgi:hypothetical protein